MKLTNNCYAILGIGFIPPWTVSSGFVVGEEKTLIIDSGPNYLAAHTIFGYAKNVKPTNEIIVVNIEKHLDHIGGNSLFHENGIKIYGHPAISRNDDDLIVDISDFNKSILNSKRKAAHEEYVFYENTRIVNPGAHVKNGEVISLGGNTEVSVIYTLGHTPTNISILVKGEKILYCGDLITSGYLPNLECGTKDDWNIWMNSLDLISELDVEQIVPGHGKIISGANIKFEITRMKELLNEAIINNKAPTVE